MGIPKTGVKIIGNNIHPKTGNAHPHSKPLKSSGQEINPFPEVMKKKVKKKKKREHSNSETPVLQVNERLFHELVAR